MWWHGVQYTFYEGIIYDSVLQVKTTTLQYLGTTYHKLLHIYSEIIKIHDFYGIVKLTGMQVLNLFMKGRSQFYKKI